MGEPIEFDGSGSFDDGSIVLYEWDFESNGVIDVHSVKPTTTLTYSAEFSGTVTLRVTDNDGDTATDTAPIVIATPALINDSLRLTGIDINQSPYPEPDAPAGIYYIGGTFSNSSSVPLTAIFFKVVTLTGNNVLRNADGGPGGVGATLSVNWLQDGALYPNETFRVDFVIGRRSTSGFQLFVDAYGIRLSGGENGIAGPAGAGGHIGFQFDVPEDPMPSDMHRFYLPAVAR